jgi:hypothetical protein
VVDHRVGTELIAAAPAFFSLPVVAITETYAG